MISLGIPFRGRHDMPIIDVTTINDGEKQVAVLDGTAMVFLGPISQARKRYPEEFSDSPVESSPAAAQTPCGSVLAMAHSVACESAP